MNATTGGNSTTKAKKPAKDPASVYAREQAEAKARKQLIREREAVQEDIKRQAVSEADKAVKVQEVEGDRKAKEEAKAKKQRDSEEKLKNKDAAELKKAIKK